jgi:hypothetical protein
MSENGRLAPLGSGKRLELRALAGSPFAWVGSGGAMGNAADLAVGDTAGLAACATYEDDRLLEGELMVDS